jgi:hypothetical protein
MRILQIGLRKARILALASIIAVGFCIVVPTALAKDDGVGGCSVALLQGSFGYGYQALVLIGPTTPPGTFNLIGGYTPVSLAGTISFDGKGNVYGVDSINFGWGGIPRTYAGTYTVVDPTAKPKNCAFTTTFLDSLGDPPDNLYMVLALDGQALELVNTNPNVFLSGRADKK